MPRKRRPALSSSLQARPETLTPENIRDRLLEGAGLDFARQSDLLRRAVATFEEGLEALSILKADSPDWFARLKAARGLVDIIGAMPSRTQSTRGQPAVLVNIQIPDWAQPMLQARGLGGAVPIPRPSATETDPT